VLVKSDNSYTYFTPDIAYHQDKFSRNFDHYINVMGADHGGYVKRIKAAVAALGYAPDKLEFLLMQLVNLKRGEEVVNMSKRTGDYVTLSEVVEEVGRDAARFFFVMRSHHSTLDFDLELAKQQTMDNPVYYIQYAYARICSIFRKVVEAGYKFQDEDLHSDLDSLTLPEEFDLVKVLMKYSDLLTNAAQWREPHRVVFFLQELAKVFQNYYTRGKTDSNYRVISTDRKKTLAKLFLIKTVQAVFRHGLNILGVSAPEKMTREEEE
jgi:arginyl-tRNA synthetase